MPHAHCLIILKEKVLSARLIDKLVWAEIPCPVRFPILHAIVIQRMIHDPCDTRDDALCRNKNGKKTCYRHFPKKLNTVTTVVGIYNSPMHVSHCKVTCCQVMGTLSIDDGAV